MVFLFSGKWLLKRLIRVESFIVTLVESSLYKWSKFKELTPCKVPPRLEPSSGIITWLEINARKLAVFLSLQAQINETSFGKHLHVNYL